MPPVPIERIRNIGIIAHIDAGKTTVTERVLYFSGKEHRMGEVHDGNTVMDWMAEERERGITITSAATSLDWKKHRLNLIDTPGHVDFTAEVERSLRVLDGAVGVFDGVAGVEAQSETVWRQADRYGVPRLAFVNKLDRMGAVYDEVVEDIRERLAGDGTPGILPMIVPVGSEGAFSGIVDPLRRVMITFDRTDRGLTVEEASVPDDLIDLMEERRAAIIETAAENSDDEVMEKFLSGEELSIEEITEGIRRGVVSRALVPVFGGSALKDIGIQPLLDAIVAYLPSPLDAGAVDAQDPRKEDKIVRCKPDRKDPLAVLAFKTFAEQHGDSTYLRVYSGVLKPNDQVWNPRRDKVERVGRILEMHADNRVAVQEAGPGSIVATVGLRFTVTGDTLCSKRAPVVLESMRFPETVMSLAIEPRSTADRQNLNAALDKLSRDDPTFGIRVDAETGQTVISGMGELHLEVLVHRLTRDFNVEAHVGKPRVAFRQTVGGRASAENAFEHMVGEKRQFARVAVEVFPEGSSDGAVGAFDGLTPAFRQAIESGIKATLEGGCGYGYPCVDVGVRVTDIEVHPQDSTEAAFESAAAQAVYAAFEEGKPVLLEPVMKAAVHTPEEFLGNVLGDLQRRKANIESIDAPTGDQRVIRGIVALAEMFGYSTALRSLSQGRAAFSMEPDSYAPVPPDRLGGMVL